VRLNPGENERVSKQYLESPPNKNMYVFTRNVTMKYRDWLIIIDEKYTVNPPV
jgi:hypothetical protein